MSAEPDDDLAMPTVNGGPKELAYDNRVAPLVKQIRALCSEHKINFFLFFALDELPGDQGILQARVGGLPDDEDAIGVSVIAAIHALLTDATRPIKETN